ncbi:MAG: helix-turn-helix domain-containing protein [Defluviitaleaceae bacterium]|nr:helix-turn-helix domain-containing protein [Defluviitaleaceae bacterium]
MGLIEYFKQDGIIKDYYIAGPLNLDITNKQASTAMGSKIPLSSQEFDTLQALAQRQNDTVDFESIYQIAWNDGNFDRQTVKASLKQLIQKISEAGQGFMWIEYVAETGYRFKVQWGRGWAANNQDDINKIGETTDMQNISFAANTKQKPSFFKNKKVHKALYATTATATAAAIGIAVVNNGGQEFINLTDDTVPLAAWQDNNDEIFFPMINDITMTADDVIITLHNPIENEYWFIFEIALQDTDEVLYISEYIAPGTTTEANINSKSLKEGENKAVINIRAYAIFGFEEKASHSTEFVINNNVSGD